MVWYKCWLETRWRFLIGLAFVLLAACSIPATYAHLRDVLPGLAASVDGRSNSFARELAEAIDAQKTYHGFVWAQWFDANFTYIATLFAALLGSGNPLAPSGRGLLFSLALPVTRAHWLRARAVAGLAELLALALLGALAIVVVAPMIGERYALGRALVHGVAIFGASSVFFGAAMLLSTAFNDVWRPLLLTCFGAIALGVAEGQVFGEHGGLFAVMSAQGYFEGGSPPWIGLLVSAVVTAVLVHAASANVARRDY
jgi:hypothetical protein